MSIKFQERKKELNNWNWQEKFKNSDDPEERRRFDEWRGNLGPAISQGVLASPSAREARRQNFSKLGKSELMRQVASNTAKKTSARPEIITQRTENLRRWRDTHPEEFQAITSKMTGTFQSKPEKMLYEWCCQTFPALDFKQNQQFRRIGKITTTQSGKRQLDIYSRSHEIVVEFDGVWHFKAIKDQNTLIKIQIRDLELNRVLPEEGFTLIRVSYDQFKYGRGGYFLESCLERIRGIVLSGEKGLFLIGDAYAGDRSEEEI